MFSCLIISLKTFLIISFGSSSHPLRSSALFLLLQSIAVCDSRFANSVPFLFSRHSLSSTFVQNCLSLVRRVLPSLQDRRIFEQLLRRHVLCHLLFFFWATAE